VPGSADETGTAEYQPLLFSIAYGMTGSVTPGHRAGRVPRPDQGTPGGNHGRRSEGVPDDCGDTAGNQLPEVRAGPAGDIRRGLATRTGRRARRRAWAS
jgi:hypothetical protein